MTDDTKTVEIPRLTLAETAEEYRREFEQKHEEGGNE